MKRSSAPITVRVGHREFVKVNATKYDWRDIYHFILTLSWAQFAGMLLGLYVFINLCFAMLYLLGGRCIAGLVPGSFSESYITSWPRCLRAHRQARAALRIEPRRNHREASRR